MPKPFSAFLASIVFSASLLPLSGAVITQDPDLFRVISLNWRGDNTFEGTFPSSGSAIAGAIPRPWWTTQTLTDSDPVTTPDLIDDHGNATTANVTFELGPGTEAHNGQPNYNGPNSDLLVLSTGKGVRGRGAGNNLFTITGQDVPYLLYDVYVYVADRPPAAGFEMRFVLNGAEQRFIQTPDNDIEFFEDNNFVQVEVTADPSSGNYMVGNYIVFRNISDPNFTIEMDSTSTLGGGNRMAVTAIQIMQVPEPSAFALLGLGAFGSALRRRRIC